MLEIVENRRAVGVPPRITLEKITALPPDALAGGDGIAAPPQDPHSRCRHSASIFGYSVLPPMKNYGHALGSAAANSALFGHIQSLVLRPLDILHGAPRSRPAHDMLVIAHRWLKLITRSAVHGEVEGQKIRHV